MYDCAECTFMYMTLYLYITELIDASINLLIFVGIKTWSFCPSH